MFPYHLGEESDQPGVEVSLSLSEHLIERVLGCEGYPARRRSGQLHVDIGDSQDARELRDLLTGKAHWEAAAVVPLVLMHDAVPLLTDQLEASASSPTCRRPRLRRSPR